MIKTLKVFMAGIVFGILFAPHSGAKTRKRLSRVFAGYKKDAKDYVVDVADKVESKVASAIKAVKKI